nr:hypothetical protein CFP56_28842 [Quercus suber]
MYDYTHHSISHSDQIPTVEQISLHILCAPVSLGHGFGGGVGLGSLPVGHMTGLMVLSVTIVLAGKTMLVRGSTGKIEKGSDQGQAPQSLGEGGEGLQGGLSRRKMLWYRRISFSSQNGCSMCSPQYRLRCRGRDPASP